MTTSQASARVYNVPGISCDHCKNAIESHVDPLDGVDELRGRLNAKEAS